MTIILLPGTMCDARLFAPLLPALQNAGWRARILGYDSYRDLRRWADAAELPARFALVGLSLGGVAAFALLRRFARRVTHLALFNANPGGETEAGAARREADYARAAEIGLEKFIGEEMLPRQVHPTNREKLRRIVVEMALAAGMAGWRSQLDLLSTRPDSRPLLPAINIPTLIACGEADKICPPSLHREMAAAIPGAMLNIFPQCGHLSTLEQPAAASAALLELLRRDDGKK